MQNFTVSDTADTLSTQIKIDSHSLASMPFCSKTRPRIDCLQHNVRSRLRRNWHWSWVLWHPCHQRDQTPCSSFFRRCQDEPCHQGNGPRNPVQLVPVPHCTVQLLSARVLGHLHTATQEVGLVCVRAHHVRHRNGTDCVHASPDVAAS